MGRLYQLVKKTENHKNDEASILEPIRQIFKDHITEQGKAALEKVKAQATTDPKELHGWKLLFVGIFVENETFSVTD